MFSLYCKYNSFYWLRYAFPCLYVYEYLAVYMRRNGDETQHKVKVANFSHIFIDGAYMCHFGAREICFAAGLVTMLLWGWYCANIYVVLTVATPNHQQLLAEEKKTLLKSLFSPDQLYDRARFTGWSPKRGIAPLFTGRGGKGRAKRLSVQAIVISLPGHYHFAGHWSSQRRSLLNRPERKSRMDPTNLYICWKRW